MIADEYVGKVAKLRSPIDRTSWSVDHILIVGVIRTSDHKVFFHCLVPEGDVFTISSVSLSREFKFLDLP